MTTDTSIEELDTRSTRVSATDAANIPPLAAHACRRHFSRALLPYEILGAGRESRHVRAAERGIRVALMSRAAGKGCAAAWRAPAQGPAGLWQRSTMESTALLLELDVPPILVCVKLLTPDLHGGTEAKCVRAADQSHYTYTQHARMPRSAARTCLDSRPAPRISYGGDAREKMGVGVCCQEVR